MAKIRICNGRVWDGATFRIADILTDGGVIAEIAPEITTPAEYTFDAAGRIVSPGLVDLHVHMKGISSDQFGIPAESSCFPFGVTAAVDAGSMHGNRERLEAFAVKNAVFVSARVRENHIDFPATLQLLEQYGDKVIGIKMYLDAASKHVKDITPLKELCEYARPHGLKVMVHCSNAPMPMTDIVRTLSPGDILTHVFHGGSNNCLQNDFEALRIARQRGVVLDVGFAGHVHTNFSNLTQALRSGFLPDTISTDITCCSAFLRGGRYGMTMCMSIAKQCGMNEEAIFRAVTSAPAAVLEKDAQWGYLRKGRCADIAVFEETDEGYDLTDSAGNRVYSQTGYRCVLTIANGHIMYRH